MLKGPDALLAGFGNLGGNINVVTKKPSAEERLAVSFDTGSYGLARGVIDANNAITADKKLSARVIGSAQTMDRNYGGYTGNKDWLFAPSLRYKDRLTDIIVGASINEAIAGIGAFTLFDPKTRRSSIAIRRCRSMRSIPVFGSAPIASTSMRRDSSYRGRTRRPGMHDQTELTTRAANVGYSRAGLPIADTQGGRQNGDANAIDGFLRVKSDVGDWLKASFNIGYNYSDGFTAQRSGLVYNRATLSSFDVAPIVVKWSPIGNVQIQTSGKQEGVYGQGLLEFWKLKILGGVRKNWFETATQTFFAGPSKVNLQRKNGTSPSLGVIFDATHNFSVFANYGRGEQATFTAAKDGSILPNIITTNKEAGRQVRPVRQARHDQCILFRYPAGQYHRPQSARSDRPSCRSGAAGRGIDLNIAGQLMPGWTVLGSLTRTKYALLTVNALQTVVAQQPRDTYSLYSVYRSRIADGVSGGFSGGLYGRSSSYANQLGQYVVPPSRQVDVNGFLSVKGFDINIGIRNIFDRRNYGSARSFPMFRFRAAQRPPDDFQASVLNR